MNRGAVVTLDGPMYKWKLLITVGKRWEVNHQTVVTRGEPRKLVVIVDSTLNRWSVLNVVV